MAETDPNAELDADGITVQKFLSRVLVVCPPTDFADECLRYARSSLHNVHVGTWTVSTMTQDVITGRHQDEFMVVQRLINRIQLFLIFREYGDSYRNKVAFAAEIFFYIMFGVKARMRIYNVQNRFTELWFILA